MSEEDAARLLERISATAIANQAILKCSVAGFPLTIDNAIMFVGDFLDPMASGADSLMDKINSAIEEVIDCRGLITRVASAVAEEN